ncbi:hypothetical protein O7598_08650 [Micromonospora sp. WMMC241]|uniref:hypothetical protein n=1 Tax=Micromonospora sp. WMMC241 TaxID=3015159 RepID=UPI0022B674F6|nr:hypothetical protein [Micromonospora sp. WMMC241]MCZ7436454.1 hypothetical protein [Micromonospora sp. WMMC241]
MRQQRADYTLEDLRTPPDDAPRVELVDGIVRVMPAPDPGHHVVSLMLAAWLHARTPAHPVHLYAYRLGDRIGPGGERQYELVADGSEVIELTDPFPLKLPIADIRP